MLERRDFLKKIISVSALSLFKPAYSWAAIDEISNNSVDFEHGKNVFKYLICIGCVRILGKNGVSKTDIRRTLDAIKSVLIPIDHKIVSVFPLEYIIDGKEKIENPLEMQGFRLDTRALLVLKKGK